MSPTDLAPLVLYAAIALFVIYRQLVPRPVLSTQNLVLPLALTGYGLYLLAGAPPTSAAALLGLGGALLVSVVAGAVRALTVKFWVDDQGVAMQRGTWLTVAVWVAFIAVRIGAGVLSHGAFSMADLLVGVGVSLFVQAGVTYLRGQALGPSTRNDRAPLDDRVPATRREVF